MNYSLAKKLEKAGFPQHKPEPSGVCHECFNKGEVCEPTLEELIDSCETDDRNIHLIESHTGAIANKKNRYWNAMLIPARGNKVVDKQGIGETPSEAVAMLWLKLNEK